MGKGSGNGTTRGDRKRNARRERLRALLPRDGAVIGIDLAEDKQALAVIDHDVRVLARKTLKVKAFRLGEALDWAVAQARAKGFTSVTVACEPTGPRWMQVQRLIYCMVVHGTSWDPAVAAGAGSCHDTPQHQAEAA